MRHTKTYCICDSNFLWWVYFWGFATWIFCDGYIFVDLAGQCVPVKLITYKVVKIEIQLRKCSRNQELRITNPIKLSADILDPKNICMQKILIYIVPCCMFSAKCQADLLNGPGSFRFTTSIEIAPPHNKMKLKYCWPHLDSQNNADIQS